ncbi:MAG: MBL fold metallo-hydrolase, partial [Thermomicrobiales bacterium]|nr:MBL fold metallo-hydrolase [Thermomicrobiales bacterium]
MQLSVRNLGSGSSGNALLVTYGEESLLVDCGVSRRALGTGLAAAGLTIAEISAVVLTHEHGDHIRAARECGATCPPVIATPGTIRAASLAGSMETLPPARSMQHGSFEITALAVSHDAAEPCGFTILAGGVRATVLTDLGHAPDNLADVAAASDLIVLEANHDEAMLRGGPYPAHLKRRILGHAGHLSNGDCGAFLARALRGNSRLPAIWLAHLSRTNNRPALAQATVEQALARAGLAASITPMQRQGHGQMWRAAES